jgi:hypothetical protein
MQLKDRKILKLLDSSDTENQNLGTTILKTHLTKQNVIFWYIELEKRKILNAELLETITENLGWEGDNAVLSNIDKCINHISDNHGSPESGATLIKYYNNYLASLMTHKWTTAERDSYKEELFKHVYLITAKPNKDL